MPFVIIDARGEPLVDADGHLILLRSLDATKQWLRPGERVEPYDADRHRNGHRPR